MILYYRETKKEVSQTNRLYDIDLYLSIQKKKGELDDNDMNDLKMRYLTLKNLREQKGWSLETASRIIGLSAHTLSDYEEYRVVPNIEDVSIILKMYGLLYFQIVVDIYEDIASKYNKQ